MLGAYHAVNAYGKAAGLTQLAELGTIESPILLTNTLAVGAVWEGGLRHLLDQNPGRGPRPRHRERDRGRVLRRLAVGRPRSRGAAGRTPSRRSPGRVPTRPARARWAPARAPPASASRPARAPRRARSGGHTLGCLVVSNYGSRSDLHLLVGQDVDVPGPSPEAPAQGGSIMIVLGTDAPLSERQLRRLASRGTFGLGRAGSFGANASGEYVIAFSTAHRVAHRVERDTDELHLPARRLGRRSRPVRGRGRGGAGVGPELAVRGRRDGGPRRQPRRGFPPRAPRRGAVPSAELTKTRAASPSRPRRAAREPSARRTCRTRSSCSRSCRTSR